ncbi:MAG: GAF domain-containing protein [Ferrovibrio sp.]|uniref:GAF domain-containing protein n=1 Tax=Ferrovibrio sp. TaxID=1917215 RepID=UPI00391BB80D
MIEPAIPEDEDYRLAALRMLPLLDTPPEPDFDAVVQLGRAMFAVPTCLVTLVDSHRQWFKARAGLDATETPRAHSFCGHAILQHDVMVVPDASLDERFHDNPLVLGTPFIRFYAGAPILLPSGYTIGTVCILGPEPRHDFDAGQQDLLAKLAMLALSAITLRALRSNFDRARREADRSRLLVLASPAPLALADAEGRLEVFNEAFAALCLRPPEVGGPVEQALDLGQWPPAAMARNGSDMAVLTFNDRDARLAVYRDPEGYILTTAPDGL